MVYDSRADVGGAGDVSRVAEPLRHVVDRLEHVLLGLLEILRHPNLGELDRREQGGRLGAEVLRGELWAHDLLDVGVQVAGLDVPDIVPFVAVLEDLIPRQCDAFLDYLP